MAHIVKCLYCGEPFDADKEPFVKPNVRRYAHESCAKQRKKDLEEQKKANDVAKELAAMEQETQKANLVKCLICGELVDKTNPECIKATNTRYAHRHCLEGHPEILEKTRFFDYLSHLFGSAYDHMSSSKLAEKYMKENPDWTWSGMHKAIWWYYEKRHGDKSKARGTIGILPYIYKTAYNYFLELFLAEQAARQLTEEQLEIKTKEIAIVEPTKITPKRKANIIEFEEDEE